MIPAAGAIHVWSASPDGGTARAATRARVPSPGERLLRGGYGEEADGRGARRRWRRGRIGAEEGQGSEKGTGRGLEAMPARGDSMAERDLTGRGAGPLVRAGR
jgi:hypothetical protein